MQACARESGGLRWCPLSQVVSLNEELALEAADLSLQYGLAMADAVVYATARHYEALLVTSDADFAELPGVKYLESPDS